MRSDLEMTTGRRWAKRLLIATTVSTGAVIAAGGISAMASDEFDPKAAVTALGAQTSLLWVVIGAALVIFMQAGFALVETGFCRAKHAAHVVSTNFAIFGLGFIGFFFVGFPLAFGGFSYAAFGLDKPIGSSLVGSGDWIFLFKGGWALSGGGDRTVRLWDVENASEIRSFSGHKRPVWTVAFTPDARRALSAGHDEVIKVWDVESGNEIVP